ncbi:MAG: formate/nitrite transporter family protein [Acholeplasmataceae bacterium]
MHQNVFIKAITAGLYVGIAGIIYLSVSNPVLGAVLFSFALVTIVVKNLYLYTGKIGYILPYEKGYLKMMGIALAGNIVGTVGTGLLYRLIGFQHVLINAENIFSTKIEKGFFQIFVLAIFCGFLMYVAVDSYKRVQDSIARILIIIFAVVIFILAGFEHSIANLFYMGVSGIFTWDAIVLIIGALLGNAVGGISLNLVETVIAKEKLTKKED